ncbi:MAG: hypothetical protein AABW58_02740 [Nanoarchaeota archaeon]
MVNSEIDLKEIVENLFYQRNRKFLEKPPEEYPTDHELYKQEENVFEANDYLFGNNLGDGTTFGVTHLYGGRIVLLDKLRGEDRKRVLEHEKHHRDNIADSEYMTRKKTSTEDFSPNPVVSPVGGY